MTLAATLAAEHALPEVRGFRCVTCGAIRVVEWTTAEDGVDGAMTSALPTG